jgi:hypothetical protein
MMYECGDVTPRIGAVGPLLNKNAELISVVQRSFLRMKLLRVKLTPMHPVIAS